MLKQGRDFEGQRQAGIVLSRFDGIDGLARDLQPAGRSACDQSRSARLTLSLFFNGTSSGIEPDQ